MATKKNAGKKKNTKNGKRHQRMSSQAVIVEVMMNGVGVIEKLIEANRVSIEIVRKANRLLKEKYPQKADLLDGWLAKHYPVTPGGRGRTNPVVGDTRSYSAQQLKGQGETFLRLNLATLEVAKGESVDVTFHKGFTIVGDTRKAKAFFAAQAQAA